MLEGILLLLCIINLLFTALTYNTFRIVMDNQDDVIHVLNDDIQRLRDDGK